jgi:hypothetical protein
MSVSSTRNQLQDGLSAIESPTAAHVGDPQQAKLAPTTPLARQESSSSSFLPESLSFTSFPEGEGAANPDIPSEPMLNKLYNKVLSLTTSGTIAGSSSLAQQTSIAEDKEKQDTNETSNTALDLAFGTTTRESKTPSITSLPTETISEIQDTPAQPQPQIRPAETSEMSANRQSIAKSRDRSLDVLQPVVSTVHALGGMTRSEDEYSNVDSEKLTVDSSKRNTKSTMKEITLPGLTGFRLTREPSSDSESVSSYSVHPGRTVNSIIGRLKSGDLGREFWMKDETSHECFLCGEKFTSDAGPYMSNCSLPTETSLQNMWAYLRR